MVLSLNNIDTSALEGALVALREGLAVTSPSELERDGVIQRFEFSFELCWKTIRKCLIALGQENISASPRPILRGGFEEGLIDDVELWFEFLEARNKIAHIYSKKTAEEVYNTAYKFIIPAETLLSKIHGVEL